MRLFAITFSFHLYFSLLLHLEFVSWRFAMTIPWQGHHETEQIVYALFRAGIGRGIVV
jgi:hypothetical protein